jgi:hypothetical protein
MRKPDASADAFLSQWLVARAAGPQSRPSLSPYRMYCSIGIPSYIWSIRMICASRLYVPNS